MSKKLNIDIDKEAEARSKQLIADLLKEKEALCNQVDKLHAHILNLNKELNKARIVIGANYLNQIKENA
jgi:uncharacterized protein YlxW (UPF0749 family)